MSAFFLASPKPKKRQGQDTSDRYRVRGKIFTPRCDIGETYDANRRFRSVRRRPHSQPTLDVQKYEASYAAGGSTQWFHSQSTSDLSGRLRIQRVGSTATLYYWDGAEWVNPTDWDEDDFTTDDLYLSLVFAAANAVGPVRRGHLLHQTGNRNPPRKFTPVACTTRGRA